VGLALTDITAESGRLTAPAAEARARKSRRSTLVRGWLGSIHLLIENASSLATSALVTPRDNAG
jgi:hypothetical protein